MIRVLFLILLTLATLAQSAPLVHMTATGGFTRFGVGHFEMKVDAAGNLTAYDQETESWSPPVTLSAADLKGLNEAIAATNFACLTTDEKVTPPSAYDGQDVTVIVAGQKPVQVWKLTKNTRFPVGNFLWELLERYRPAR